MTFAAGTQVFLSGLPVEHAELETLPCEVVNVAATWVMVKVVSSGQLLKISHRNLRTSVPTLPGGSEATELIQSGQLPIGTRVVVYGLRQSPETNGQQALVECWLPGEERYSVTFGRDIKDKNKGALLRPGNVRLATEQDDRYLIGRFVKRPLGNDRFILGRVTRHHASGCGLFVRYEDGDREHLTALDVLKLTLIPDDREHSRLAGILAKYPESPSDDENDNPMQPQIRAMGEPPVKQARKDSDVEGAPKTTTTSDVRIIADPVFFSHRGGGQDRDGLWLKGIRDGLVEAELYDTEPEKEELATVEEIIESGVHSEEYMRSLVKVAALITDELPRVDLGKKQVIKLLGRALAICDGECIMDKTTMRAVLLRAGLTRKALFSVLRGDIECGFVLARPACHHVPYIVREDDEDEVGEGGGGEGGGHAHHHQQEQQVSQKSLNLKPGDEVACGFCFVNAIAFGIRAAQKAFSRPDLPLKVAILDVDVHHGNGNEHVFYDDPNVLHISLHRYGDTADGHRIMPASGHYEDCGGESGRGFNVNFEMHLDDGDAEYCDAMRRIVFPILEQFQADVVVLLCGFDALDHSSASDKFKGPGMDCSLTPRWFWWLGQNLRARFHRLLVSTEGGYDPVQAGLAGECLVRGLNGQIQPDYYERAIQASPRDDHWREHVKERVAFFRSLGWNLPDL
jgi:acetoin utilization deacetylase AcuC-like enzyme